MKKILGILFVGLALVGCSTIPEQAQSLPEGELFGLSIFLDPDAQTEFAEDGQILRGTTGAEFSAGNSKASFFVPAGVAFEYVPSEESYVFLLEPEQRIRVESSAIDYLVHEFLLFKSDVTFTGRVDGKYSFAWEGKPILFIRNDNPVWRENEDFAYDFYSVAYRDELERDNLLNYTFRPQSALTEQFGNHEGYGHQMYGGSGLAIKIEDWTNIFMHMAPIEDRQEIVDTIRSMQMARPYVTDYLDKLIIRFEVLQDEALVPAQLHLLVNVNERDTLRELIQNKETTYLLFRMNYFNDFSATGTGILYFAYDQERYDYLLSGQE